MNSALLGEIDAGGVQEQGLSRITVNMLRSRLVNLTLDWELAALSLDAKRYKAAGASERESLRDSATAYRKCVAELTEVLSASSLMARKAR